MMDPGRIFGRGISFPPRVGADGRVAWSEGEVNVRESIRIVLMTDQRERIRLPQFGGTLHRFLFEPNTVATRRRIQDQIAIALARWEPRIAVQSIDVEPDADRSAGRDRHDYLSPRRHAGGRAREPQGVAAQGDRMPLTIPTLDDARYQDLLDEALARIPVHNPEWTNFNRSDPGVTLIEVFAFLTESLLYRANQIPERNRRKFLSLLGVPLQPASSARGLVTFANDRGPRQTITLNAGIEVRAGEVPFRTERGLDVLPIEARAFFKRPLPGPAPELRGLLPAALRVVPRPAARRPTSACTRPCRFRRAGDAALQAPLEAVDQSIWIALLLRAADDPPDDRTTASRTTSDSSWPADADARRGPDRHATRRACCAPTGPQCRTGRRLALPAAERAGERRPADRARRARAAVSRPRSAHHHRCPRRAGRRRS